MNCKKNIHWATCNFGTLSQIMSSGVEFALISEDDYQCSPFCYCKDFIHDAIQGAVNNKPVSIYGFSYSPKSPHQPYLKKAKLLVTNSSDPFLKDKISNCLDFLHQIERHLDMDLTTVKLCSRPPRKYCKCGVWLFEGHKRWINSAPMVSMYTLLIRVGFGHKIGSSYEETMKKITDRIDLPYQSVDTQRLIEAMPGIKKIISKGDKKIFYKKMASNYPPKVSISSVHNSMGIIGFATGRTKKIVPRWHKSF